ncbi:NAD(P)/FAD-dependent oxidoreductase [Streptococcus chenjunshii]|uniref:NAD(P)/FAD-dependent oxidoreductase n=1 Tax=Streptococcus chenjunshii TaxID=2173853 RepID=A0A372KM25_9STRE|nr:NAD(P)/FAD-dependent oxidoreductase [Streptococcus chenjunshii]AXQ79103.1 NAD(P)/FAD-dependent oxidoreductase [Streptococcus chenjunshii]RFU50298.1 NAD(P)/FAD-dependent oxidoreductase [Streptococcus chenjunshii]RFU53329.1 NAD(P)/FAD-dependent oxidoreductase [Streptococcus chenjunshii]
MTYDYDIVFIGSGHASWHAAVTLAQSGKKVAVIEKDMTAGTCTNYGCNAKFLLDSPFEFLDGLDRYERAGIGTKGTISWEELMAFKKREIPTYAPFMEGMFAQMNIDLLKGYGKLRDEHTVAVDDKAITADYIVLGTGQRPARLNIEGKELLHDSRAFLELDSLPNRITFVGAGIISMEFATMAVKLGSEVHIVEFADKALAAYPENDVRTVVDKLRAEGVQFHFGQAVEKVEALEAGLLLTTAQGLVIETDYVLDATGRIPNVENLGLEDLGIEYNRSGIVVNDYLQTAVPHIFASGDVVDKTIPRLTPTASFESDYIADFILGVNEKPISYPVVPNLVFTFPRIAQVGVTVAEAKADPDNYKIVEVPFGQQIKFQTKLEDEARFTLIVNKNKELAGASLLSNEAGEMINLITLMINQKLKAADLSQMIFAFPGTSNALINAVKTALS